MRGNMYTIKTPKTLEDFKAYYALRYKVLREPWGHPKGTEKDDYEPISEHFMAVDENDEVIGVVKLYEKSEGVGHISHLAVAQENQQEGVDHLLLETVEERARARGFHTLEFTARVTAAPSFEKYGFRIVGVPSLLFATIHLVLMEKD